MARGRGRRLRGELADRGWTITVFGASEVESARGRCIDRILKHIRALTCRGQKHPGSGTGNSWGEHHAA